eukprot:s338_g8.t1
MGHGSRLATVPPVADQWGRGRKGDGHQMSSEAKMRILKQKSRKRVSKRKDGKAKLKPSTGVPSSKCLEEEDQWGRGVALGDICLHFVWQAWHLRHWAGSGDGLGRRCVRVAPRFFCVAGVALGEICLRFVWQAWHLVTSAFTLCGRRGTYGTGLGLVTALVGAGSGRWVRALGPCGAAFLLRGRRGAWRHLPSFCLPGVALGNICLHFVWQAWALWHWAGSGDGLGRRWVRVAPRLFCVAGVALGDICLRFVWQAWHLATSAFTLCGRRGTYGTGLALVTALGDAGSVWRRASFARQVWPLATSAFVLCGRRGTW